MRRTPAAVAHDALYKDGMKVLRRVWTGIVGAVAGGVLSVLLQIMGQITVELPIEYLPWILLVCAGGGFLVGVLVGPRSVKAV